MQINFSDTNTSYQKQLLESVIAPRPIGLVSTLDWEGNANLAPFSFFNVVSVNPAILVFSPLRRIRNNTTKDTMENCWKVPEAVIHVVDYAHIQQVNLCANEYGSEVDEFVKAGFTKQKAALVKPYMIQEIGIKFECRIIGMKSFGDAGGAGMLCMAEVLAMHIEDQLLTAEKLVDGTKLSLVARMGEDKYLRVTPSAMFTLPKSSRYGIGFDQLPTSILSSTRLTANHLGLLASVPAIPPFRPEFSNISLLCSLQEIPSAKRTEDIHDIARRMLDLGLIEEAWQVLLREDVFVAEEEGLMVIDRMD